MMSDHELLHFSNPFAFVLGASMAFIVIAGLALGQRPGPRIHGTFDGDPMYTVIPPGAIPAIVRPEFLTGPEAAAQMSPEEPVIGVVIDGQARAYSTWHLDAHEIVNDGVGEIAFAVTW